MCGQWLLAVIRMLLAWSDTCMHLHAHTHTDTHTHILPLSSVNYPHHPTPADEERIGQKRRKKLDHYTNFFRGGHGGSSGGGAPPPSGGDPGAGGMGDGGQGAGEDSVLRLEVKRALRERQYLRVRV